MRLILGVIVCSLSVAHGWPNWFFWSGDTTSSDIWTDTTSDITPTKIWTTPSEVWTETTPDATRSEVWTDTTRSEVWTDTTRSEVWTDTTPDTTRSEVWTDTTRSEVWTDTTPDTTRSEVWTDTPPDTTRSEVWTDTPPDTTRSEVWTDTTPDTTRSEVWTDTTRSEIWTDTTTTTEATTWSTHTWPITTGSPTTKFAKESTVCKNSVPLSNDDTDNYGDLICTAQDDYSTGFEDNVLLIRDTLVNSGKETTLTYGKNLENVIISSVNVLNFGRKHAFTSSVVIINEFKGYFLESDVEIDIEIPPSVEARLFVELYGRKYKI
ncbi:hypothetical protein Zmor_016273 [Zophobas morio]|uniref:Uncharacterized protein n=1 Tax=Zophobas morio TaxID=2755281 RepID=A0AA38MI19_9CUCU|nr:hypothetical protein Zmor_016273 [Zophobas morio]